ncbi:hypothetical protein [Cohnella herbarum]|uniref:Uncharacterized protein n=1 Tax=Cohnella herbarum TaxID=2728023 RepID=A0A7Z2ZK08_9BACL|nr:hypothetical protein [Cohnella herbarum]QJD82716.1 hypothetical protein HH215_05660 [Cohnella herbarum]
MAAPFSFVEVTGRLRCSQRTVYSTIFIKSYCTHSVDKIVIFWLGQILSSAVVIDQKRLGEATPVRWSARSRYTMFRLLSYLDERLMTAEPAELDKQLFYDSVLREPSDLINVTHTVFDHPRLLQKPHSIEQSGSTMRIIPSSEFAIRAKTPLQKEAWKLLSFLLSDFSV